MATKVSKIISREINRSTSTGTRGWLLWQMKCGTLIK
jgi:hypothetical protein